MYLPLINGLQKTRSGSRKLFYIIRCSILLQFASLDRAATGHLSWKDHQLEILHDHAGHGAAVTWQWYSGQKFQGGEVARASGVMLFCRDSVFLW